MNSELVIRVSTPLPHFVFGKDRILDASEQPWKYSFDLPYVRKDETAMGEGCRGQKEEEKE